MIKITVSADDPAEIEAAAAALASLHLIRKKQPAERKDGKLKLYIRAKVKERPVI